MPGKAIVAATDAMLTIGAARPAGPPGRMARKACLMPSDGAQHVDLEHLADVVRVQVHHQAG